MAASFIDVGLFSFPDDHSIIFCNDALDAISKKLTTIITNVFSNYEYRSAGSRSNLEDLDSFVNVFIFYEGAM